MIRRTLTSDPDYLLQYPERRDAIQFLEARHAGVWTSEGPVTIFVSEGVVSIFEHDAQNGLHLHGEGIYAREYFLDD